EISLILSEKARVFDFFAIRGRQKRLKSHVHANNLRRRWHPLRRDLDRKGDVPLVCARAFQADGLDLSLNWTMPNDFHAPNFRDDQVVASDRDTVPILRVGDRTIAIELFVARVSSILCAFLYAAEKRLECQIDANLNILQDLAMYQLETR